MSGLSQPTEFFVVGGPVQPGRACYVERAADRTLVAAVAAGRLCCVLGPPGVGKSSLLLRVARTLRGNGMLVAVVDVRKPAEHGALELARRIAAALELGVDVDAWWTTRARDRDDKLVQFFWEIVLTNTTAPIAVLVDDVEAVVSSPLGSELRAVVSGCHARRGAEPDFARLNFVLAGAASLRQLAGDKPDATFGGAEVIEPEDLSAQDAYRFAAAFGGELELAHGLLDRICAWTGGHPYLTQKVARGVARKGGRLEDVERVVREQLLAPGMADGDPLLLHARALLMEPSRAARRARKLLPRLGAGGTVPLPADAAVWERLWLSGAVRVDAGRVRIGNRVVKELVAARWLKVASGGRRLVAVAAVLAALLAVGGYWYTQYLPTADFATLGDRAATLGAQELAYRRLRGLPGFAERAGAAWLDALARQSAAAATLAAALAVDAKLREQPAQDAPADRLLADFWLRRARNAAHSEQRDAALLMAQRAASLPAAGPQAAAYLAQLVSEDYPYLERTLRLTEAPAYWRMRFADSLLLSLDAEGEATRTPFDAAAGAEPPAAPAKLSALEHTALVREVAVTGEGSAGEFELTLAVQHPAGDELLVTLRAPSGAEASVSVPRNDGVTEAFGFPAERGSELAQLADEGISGVWRLTIVDRTAGSTGTLASWSLRFGVDMVADDPPSPLAIPDPTRVEDVAVLAVGERAAAWPKTSGVVGSVALWNLATGQREHDFTLRGAPRQVAIDATGERLLAATDDTVWVWNAVDGALVARVATQTEFVLPPVFSADGAFFAIAERVDGANPLYSVLRSSDASLVTSFEGATDAQSWEVGRGARYVALLGPPTVVRVLDTRRGTELARLPHATPVRRVLHAPDGTSLLTIDDAGALTAWTPAAPGVPRSLGRAAAPESVSLAGNGSRFAYTRDDGAVTVLDLASGVEVARLRVPRASPVTTTQLSADGIELVTLGGSVRRWRLPSASPPAPAANAEVVPTALALDRAADVVAVGFASGQVDVATAGELARPRAPLAFFGHRGQVTAAAADATHNLVATGGADGIVRLWNSASGTPIGVVMQPASAPIDAVALAADGSLVANAAARTVRIANVADGRVAAEIAAAGAVTAMVFAPDGTLVVGDVSGAIAIVSSPSGRGGGGAHLGAAVSALAFSQDGARLAAGDGTGAVRIMRADGGAGGDARSWPGTSVRWLDFSPDGRVLFVATDEWLHALDATTPELQPLASRLRPAASRPERLAAISATAVQRAAFDARGMLIVTSVELATADGAADAGALVARDWPAAVGLRLDDNGEPVTNDP